MTVKYQYSKYAYTTGSWTNLPASNLVDGKSASKTYSKGGSPAPVYFDVGFDIGAGNKVDNASFCISIPQRDGLSAPVVKFYDGSKYGRNVHKHPSYIFKTMNSPSKHGNSPKFPTEENREKGGFEGSTIWYKYYYNCKNITRQQLKNLIVCVDFGKASSGGKARIGWARMEIKYSKDTSYNIGIDSPDKNNTVTVTLGQDYIHEVELYTNSSVRATAYYNTFVGAGMKFTGAGESGVPQTTGKWKGWRMRYVPAKGTHICKLKYTPTTLGTHTITDKLANANDKGKTMEYKWYIECVEPNNRTVINNDPPWQLSIKDNIQIIPELLFVNTDKQYIKVIINGSYNAYDSETMEDDTIVYRWNANDNCSGSLSNMLTMIEGSIISKNDNCDIDISVENQTISVTPNNNNPFSLEILIAVNPTDNNDYANVDVDGYYYDKQFFKHSLYDELVIGYYYNNNFYNDSEHTEIIIPTDNIYYYDKNTGMGYRYVNSIYEQVVLADSIIYWDNLSPENNKIYLDAYNKKRFKYYKQNVKVCRTGNSSTSPIDIFGEKTFTYNLSDSTNTPYKTYCNNVLSTKIYGINTIKCESSRSCFFESMDTDYSVSVETPQAFFGILPIHRPHQADNQASTKNGLIKKSYLNRKYTGKTGEIDEEIGMELFLTPAEVATLQSLVKLDKPVPINLVPHIKDGDPLNHRGWAELYEITNIEKINSFTYKCEPNVDYLTHSLNVPFEIIKNDNINYFKVPFYLSTTHDFTDKLTDIMNVNNNKYSDIQDDYGYLGYYELSPRNKIEFISNRPVSQFSDIDIKWRDVIGVFTSRDLDDDFTVKVQLVKDVTGEEDPNVYFEYMYTDFKHYNATNGYTMNMFKTVKASYLENGIMQSKINSNLSLLNNDLTTLANLNKEYTKMWLNSSSIVTENDNYIDIILSTNGGTLISGELVTITVENDFGYYDKKVYMSDMYGRLRIPTNLPDAEYNITAEMPETKVYRPSIFKTEVVVEKELTGVVIDYVDDYTTVFNNDTIKVKVVDRNGNPLVQKNVIVDIRNTDSTHYGACINYITDNEGCIYPVIKTDGGTKIIRARFISDGVYANSTLSQTVYVYDDYKKEVNIDIENYEVEVDQVGKEYIVQLYNLDVNGNKVGISGETINFILYNNEEYIERYAITNENGFASIPLYITNGAWYIDAYYAGKVNYNSVGERNVIYNPTIKTGIVKNIINEKKKTLFTNISNTILESPDDDLFNVTLVDNDYMPLSQKPVRFIAEYDSDVLFDGIVITDDDGVAELPLYDNKGNVNIKFIYDGDNSYESSEGNSNVAYKYGNSSEFDDTKFTISNNIIHLSYGDNSPLNVPIVMTINKMVNNNLIYNSNDNYTIYGLEGNNGNFNIPNLPEGTYNINVTYEGNNSTMYKPCNNKFIIECDDNVVRSVNITPISIINGDNVETDYPIVNMINNTISLTNLNDNNYNNKYFKMKIRITDSITNEPISNAYVLLDSDCKSAGYTDNDGYITLEILNKNTISFTVDVDVDVGVLYDNTSTTFNFDATINNYKDCITTIDYIDEDYEKICFQEMTANTTSDTNDYQINDYYKIRLINRNLNDVVELDYMGVNKLNNNIINFYVDTGIWNMYVYAYNRNGYCDTFVEKTLTIDNDTGDKIHILDLIEQLNSGSTNSIVDDYENETMFGSLIRMKLRENKVTVYDFGYTDNDNTNNVKLKYEDIPLYNGNYYLKIIVEYYNVNNPLASNNIDKNDIEGYLQVKLTEDLENSELADMYSNIIVSPVPLPDDKCLFTRLTEDGRLYYYNYNKVKNKRYIGSPYNQYKGGTNLLNELGADIFDVETLNSNLFYVSNGICKMGIHRLGGYIELYVRDNEGQWLLVNVLKVRSDYSLSIQNYSDDFISINYSGITFTMWRGRPFIEIKHNGKDIEILNYKDRVFCEINRNGMNMRLIEESNVDRATFDVNTSVQKFDKALQIGQNIGLDNFDLYDISDE